MRAIPLFYNPQRVGAIYPARAAEAIQAGSGTRLAPGAEDQRQIVLLLVDAQVDFIHPEGALSVPGAVDDTRRTIEWMLRNLGRISQVAASLDSHVPRQIFFSSWWVGSDGMRPEPYTTITAEQVCSGQWSARFEPEWSADYVQRLEQQAKKQLMVWPYHTMIGTAGHTLMPALYEAIAYHAAARSATPRYIHKGTIDRTEYYSLVEPEIPVPEAPGGTANLELLDWLMSFDLIYVAGQAKSHCVLETLNSLVRHWGDRPEALEKVRVLLDCISSVQHPEIDFEALCQPVYEGLVERGVRLVRSTDPID